jgi:hypothetical protein
VKDTAVTERMHTAALVWRIMDRSFVVQHQLHPDALAAFDKTARMTADSRKFTTSESE